MNPRRTRFVQEYLVDRNGAGAAVRAGYSPRTARQIAHKLLTKVDVASAVRTGEAQLAARVELDRERALNGLLEAIDTARAQRNPIAQIAGWREIARICGYYAAEHRKVDVNIAAKRVIGQMEVLSDAELLAVVAAVDDR